jgi:hypothetical protein
MINIYDTNVRIEDLNWHEVMLSYHVTDTSIKGMHAWCENHPSGGLFRYHFTLKFPIYQGAFWFEHSEDAVEFRLRWF